MTDRLKTLRDRIDALDEEILRLANARAEIAHEIGTLKQNGAIYRPEREAQVLRRLQALNRGPLPAAAVANLFTQIMSACRALEDSFAVAFLGPRGTFSEEAAIKHFGASTGKVVAGSIDEVFRKVQAGSAGYGVVPVENSTEGAVGRTLDLLLATPLRICGEIALPVHHHLLAKGTGADAPLRIYSHAQSLAQCHDWLEQNHPGVVRVAVVSNAEAARLAAAEPGAAAIASRAAAELYGLDVLASNIEDDPNNTTRFLVLGTHDAAGSGRDKTSLVMSAPNRPGAVHALLSPLARHGVSMTRLESRPSRTGLWEYVFFVDLEGHREDPPVAGALGELQALAAFLKVLGSYPVAVY
ncbi:MAG TPA: prephenate dehydratase [Burkholderiales bacterium]|nr:prephenate dehydratase [Betaproteobacteria bacterium]HQR53219.1 prephenate dehydratase [Burkholderiales bacterium]